MEIYNIILFFLLFFRLGAASNYRLHIHEVEEEDFGKYVCHVTNSKGETSTEVTLTGRFPGSAGVQL